MNLDGSIEMLYLKNLIHRLKDANLRLGNMFVRRRDVIKPFLGRSGSRITWNNTKEFSLTGANIQVVVKLLTRNQISKSTWESTQMKDPSSACMDVVKDSGLKLTAKTIQEGILTSGKYFLFLSQYEDFPCTYHAMFIPCLISYLDSRPFKCGYCNRRFYRRNVLKEHLAKCSQEFREKKMLEHL